MTTYEKISKFVNCFSQKPFDLERKILVDRISRTNISRSIEICDGGGHGLGEQTWGMTQ